MDRAVEVTVHLPRPMHVYEMRSGRHAGPVSAFETGVRPWWATFLVLSERALPAAQLRAEGDRARPGSCFELIARVPDTGAVHALKLRAFDPDGREAPWFSRTVFVEDGTLPISLPIAANERQGDWLVTATDLYTRKSAQLSFAVTRQ